MGKQNNLLGLCVPFLGLLLATFTPTIGALENVGYPPYNFFPSDDLTNVTWAHGVNSQRALDEAMSDPSIKMLEADLKRGHIKLASGIVIPVETIIMAHPPDTTSDLSFLSFIDKVVEFNMDKPVEEMKGVKLDFKDSYSASLGTLMLKWRNSSSNGTDLRFPIWLNADILKGPVNAEGDPMISPAELFKLWNDNVPGAILSVGWTTAYNDQSDGDAQYTRQNVEEMVRLFNNGYDEELSSIPVTFPVRAVLAQNSLANLMYLLNASSRNSTLTLWTADTDPRVNYTKMSNFINIVGRNRVFIDMPYNWQDQNSSIRSQMNLSFVIFCSIVVVFLCELRV